MKNFEMASSDKAEEVVMATQRSLINCMLEVLQGLKTDTKMNGMTWEQLEFFLQRFKEKKPTIITQYDEF